MEKAEQPNIAKQRAAITWVQWGLSMVLVSQAVFWFTSIYKDVQFEAEQRKINTENIIRAGETAKRRIKNSEEKTALTQKISHLNTKYLTDMSLKDMDIKILTKELSYVLKVKK
jgi:hypothetical protein